MVKIDPRINGIHSFAEALKAFKKFHENPNDPFALKDSILRSHHALETLFKDALYRQNPILLANKKIKVKMFLEGYEKFRKGELATELDELPTANLVEVVERLRKFGLLKGLSEDEYKLFLDSIKRLTFCRNKLQHFALSADPSVIGRILGNVLPRALEALEQISFHHPVFGDLPRTSVLEDLKRIFPEAPTIIDLLRHDYDRLIQEAIRFFKGKKFDDQVLKLKIADHGMVGAPPYLPDLSSEGFLTFEYDHSSLMEMLTLQRMGQTGELPYSARIQISQPTFTENQTFPNRGVAKGTLEFYAQVILDRADPFIILPNAEEKIAVLRGITIKIRASLEYEAEAFMTEHHYDCEKILKANGQLDVNITAIPKGFKSKDVEIIGKYKSNLNEENAPFRLHSFLEPDGSLKESSPRILEWIINTKGNVKFR